MPLPHPAPERVLDARGTFCPVPIIETAKAVKAMAAGEVLLVVGTDPGIESDMPAWCRSTRNELVELRREGPELHALIRKSRG
ncbi:MAG: sulfurtransferase TusA family protein [Myxococcales bacterium]